MNQKLEQVLRIDIYKFVIIIDCVKGLTFCIAQLITIVISIANVLTEMAFSCVQRLSLC